MEYVFIFMPLILLMFAFYVFIYFKKWLDLTALSYEGRKLFFRMYIFFALLSVSPLLIMNYYGREYSFEFNYFVKIFYLLPSYFFMLSYFALFWVLITYNVLRLPFLISRKLLFKFFDFRYSELYSRNRRIFLKRSALAVSASVLSINTIGVIASEFDFRVTRKNIKLKLLPERLKGFSITHISDFHFGTFMDLDRFIYFAREINNLNSDIIVITGDLVDRSVLMLPSVVKAIDYLKAKLGIYACIGNHEYYTGFNQCVYAFRESKLTLLIDKAQEIKYRDSSFYLLGINYPVIIDENNSNNFIYEKSYIKTQRIIRRSVDRALSFAIKPDLVKILLAHHPNSFDIAAENSIDLTLSGHTHGGQIVFSPWGHEWSSLMKVAFRYVKGYYSRFNSHLYVNSGLGHWMPIRFNCPVEITRITLV